MSRNYYSEINLHLVWHTKQSLPLLNPDVKKAAYAALESRIRATDGVYLHQVGGIENHVHVAVTIPPTLLISDWIGKLKGGSSHDVNQQSMNRDKQLQWQAGYGVVSFGKQARSPVNGAPQLMCAVYPGVNAGANTRNEAP
ncbi:Transposase IS200 like protein [Posidoniimonas polymericola]|uniref:Transposase IS200 like protein n=1 Tax=Posidoniimonas polymericola TaxID=2528002 RepID=A0A5C5YT18_9BACT|nr:IS200/IS605 family transposase [Posidoniimonas polymericola]TWT78144.1 Transposase IS200 like protein [Posidoniimonas polymericola]